MVLTEAFAVGTPVVASDIAGYSDVVSDGVDGVLFPRGDAERARADAARARRRRAAARGDVGRRGRARAASRGRSSPPRCSSAYEDAIAMPAPRGALARAAVALGLRAPTSAAPARAQRRLASLERDERSRREQARRRRCAAARSPRRPLGAPVALAALAVEKIGPGRIAQRAGHLEAVVGGDRLRR